LLDLPRIDTVEWNVGSYLINCTPHQMLVQPGDVALAPQDEAPNNRVWFTPGTYSVYDLDVTGQPVAANLTVTAHREFHILKDGNRKQWACPAEAESMTANVSQPAAIPLSAPTKTTAELPPVATTPVPDFTLVGLPTEAEGELVFDFAGQMCDAEWYTRGQALPCPGDTQSSAGYVMKLDGEAQGLPSNINILLAYTPQENYETIFSKYPAFTVQEGDRFRAVLTCKEHTFCDVEFVLDFSNEKGSAGLKSWRYLFADEPIVVDYPLDALAGQTVQFHLNVRARGNPVEAYAVWIAPHIYRPTP
jgi:hypothetical protein